MSQQPSGWYDDPSNPDLLRYWDGVSWSDHTAPRKSPTASSSAGAQSGFNATQSQGPSTPVPQGSGWQRSPSQPTQSSQSGWQGQAGQSPQSGQGGQVGQGSPQGRYPGAPGASNWMHDLPTTADGVELAGWGRRLGAWLIDGLILLALSLIVSRLIAPDVWAEFSRAMNTVAQSPGDQTVTETAANDLTRVVMASATKLGLSQFLITTVYCIGFWTTTAQTLGKMVVGISVRRMDRPGPLDLATALRRRIISCVQLLPVVGVLWLFLDLLDGLWPLWDSRRQTLHDKVAATQVVVGKQPRPDAKNRPA